MRLEQYLTEKASKNTIVVDVQPMYERFFRSRHMNLLNFLTHKRRKFFIFIMDRRLLVKIPKMISNGG